MTSVLVTGGAGYIGSHVCKALKRAGFLPVTIDNLSQGHAWAVQWGPLVECAIDDAPRLREAILQYKPRAAIHLASSINVRDSIRDPFFYYQNNVTASLKFFEVLCEEGVKDIVFSSSAAVYGQPEALPIKEDHVKRPMHPYGKSKLMVEEILQDLALSHGVVFAALRYFNACGADPEVEIGEAHDPETHLIPLVLASAFDLRPPLKINGQDFPTPDGTPIRDYIHVTDLADAHLKALLWILEKRTNLQLNLGTGTGYSIMEIVRSVERITDKKVPHEMGPRVPEDPSALVADAQKAQELLAWTPRFSDLETIIDTASKWLQKTHAAHLLA